MLHEEREANDVDEYGAVINLVSVWFYQNTPDQVSKDMFLILLPFELFLQDDQRPQYRATPKGNYKPALPWSALLALTTTFPPFSLFTTELDQSN